MVSAESICARIWKYTRRVPGGCWLWSGYTRMVCGYPALRLSRRNVSVHRLMWRLHRGPIPAGLYVCHRCDVRTCVNPAHLFLGTHADNMADMANKGHSGGDKRTGEDNPRSKLKRTDVIRIRSATAEGQSLLAVARKYGVTRQAIDAVVRRKTWRHV